MGCLESLWLIVVALDVCVQAPSYGETLEEQGRFTAKTVLPFNAYGTLALSHPADDVNGGEMGSRGRGRRQARGR